MAEESDAPTRTDCSTTATDALDSSEREQRDATQKAAERLVDVEWLLHRERRGEPLRPLPVRADARGWHGAARVLFKLRYAQDDPLTRWFATTRLADYESRRRQAQLDDASGSVDGCSPVWTVRVAAAVLAALLLLTLLGAVAFSAFDLGGCGARARACLACGTTAEPEIACTHFDEFWMWTNCSAACLPNGYRKMGDKPATSGGGCARVLWQACYGADACWSTPDGPDKPPAKLECARKQTIDDEELEYFYKYYSTLRYECEAKSSFCYVFKPYNASRMYFDCYKGGRYQIKTANDGVGCGLSVPDGGCRHVAADVGQTNQVGQLVYANHVGQLCCCTGDGCNFNKALGRQAIDKSEAKATCMAGTRSDSFNVEAVRDLQAKDVQHCKLGDICIDYAVRGYYTYNHERGCHFSGVLVLDDIQYQCAKQLGTANRTCFKITHCFKAPHNKKEFGVCCCRGDNCTADNAVDYHFPDGAATSPPCAVHYELVDGVPDGDASRQVEHGCVTTAMRVPAAALDAACAHLGDGCFVTRDVDGKNVSVCCCRGADCVPDDVRVYVANEAPTPPPPPTSSEATSTVSGGDSSATTGDCGWAVWTAAVCAALSLLLLVAVAPAAFVAYELSDVKETERWVKLSLQVKQPAIDWPSDFRKHMLFCVQEASDALAKHQ